MKKVYLLNSPIIPIEEDMSCSVHVFKLKNVEEIKNILYTLIELRKYELISAIGHESTAKILSKLLDKEVNVNRIAVTVEEDDYIFAFTLEFRLPVGKELTEEELEAIIKEKKFSFTIMHIYDCIPYPYRIS